MSEFTNNYKTFSDKMDAGNQQYKDLLEQYKQRQALAGGLATGQSGPTFTDLMFNRQPVDNTAKISNLLTGGNQADLAGNKELNDRNDMQVKVGLDAAVPKVCLTYTANIGRSASKATMFAEKRK